MLVDYDLLRAQKGALHRAMDMYVEGEEKDLLTGLSNFLDSFQDNAVDVEGKTSREVFGFDA
jgi:flagellar hook-associated protein FlgK